MVEYTYRLLRMFAESEEIVGRKRLQKMFYILQSLGYDYDLEYTYQRYGPYSAQLQLETDLLVTEGLISEKYDKRTYTYTLTESGKAFLRMLKEKGLLESPQVPAMVLDELKQHDAQLLELVSTIKYLTELGLKNTEVEKKVMELKPHLVHRYDEATSFAKGIETLNRNRGIGRK